jgi:alpha-ribazole phosphatase
MTLWVVRHARPLVAPGTCYGALDLPADSALTQEAAQALSLQLPAGCRVLVSPLQRCQQLAQALADLRPDLDFSTDERLREMDFGSWEGVAWSDIPRVAVDAWTADFANHRFGGVESANEVLARVAQVWDALHAQTPAASNAAWICHSGVMQAVRVLQQGVRRVECAQDWPVASLDYGQWVCL